MTELPNRRTALARLRDRAIAQATRSNLPLLLALSVLLHGCAIWWGIPHGKWAPDEADPLAVNDAISARFSGGWAPIYGPVPFYIYSLFFIPVRLAANLGLVDLNSADIYNGLRLAIRLVSLAMATGIVAILYVTAERLWTRRTAVFAALVAMSIVPFVFYAKTGNVEVPYTFFALLAIVNYGRIVAQPEAAAYWSFATFATLAVCTKDQAYGLFPLPALHILWITWRSRETKNLFLPLMGATIWAAVLFGLCYNAPFNWEGLLRHFRFVTSLPDRVRMFDPGLSGQLALALATVRTVAWSMNWVGLAAALAGIVLAGYRASERRTVWLLLPAASYYVTFIMAVGIVYDRYLLAVCLLLAPFAGRSLALVWDSHRAVAVRATVPILVAFSIARGGSIDLLMLGDSRLTVEQWFRDHVGPDASIAVVGVRSYLPRIVHPRVGYYRRPSFIPPRARPDYIVLNAEYVVRFEQEPGRGDWFRGILSGEAGYERVLSAKSHVPWALLWHERMFQDDEEHPFTNLDKVNPRIEVYRRVR